MAEPLTILHEVLSSISSMAKEGGRRSKQMDLVLPVAEGIGVKIISLSIRLIILSAMKAFL